MQAGHSPYQMTTGVNRPRPPAIWAFVFVFVFVFVSKDDCDPVPVNGCCRKAETAFTRGQSKLMQLPENSTTTAFLREFYAVAAWRYAVVTA
ncbi:hypothetical protein ABNK63_13860 [Rhodanobacter sp. IGA1.0]|uniref:Secreted protein n=1 Tax=Rhodanobacter sp. IGA1.0 TaxID=3158582 RepID=A0AAU7QL52_9GAMM